MFKLQADEPYFRKAMLLQAAMLLFNIENPLLNSKHNSNVLSLGPVQQESVLLDQTITFLLEPANTITLK